jgi:hypothetical protein
MSQAALSRAASVSGVEAEAREDVGEVEARGHPLDPDLAGGGGGSGVSRTTRPCVVIPSVRIVPGE